MEDGKVPGFGACSFRLVLIRVLSSAASARTILLVRIIPEAGEYRQ
jgi:hypothetical protein